MKPAPFGYSAARSIDEALELLDRAGSEARILAGGQSLGPMLNLRAARPSHLVDISRIDALRSIEERADGSLRLGAGVTHAQLEDRAATSELARLLALAAGGIGYRAIRTRGTLAGSLAHADPAADWPVVLAALGASVTATSADAQRSIPVAEFIVGMFESQLRFGEIITAIEIPAGARFTWGLRKVVRKSGEFAHALAACVHRGGDTVDVWLGALAGPPKRVNVGRAVAYETVLATLDVADDYERHLHAFNAARAVTDALDRWT